MGVIRLLLALSVVRGHTEPILGLDLVGGQRAVQLFYVISGFYMTLILSGRYVDKSRFLFYSNRLLRIFPLYLATMLLMMGLAVGNQLLTGGSSVIAPYLTMWGVLSPATLLLFIAANILILGQGLMMFLQVAPSGDLLFVAPVVSGGVPAANFLPMPQAWTIDLELTFYALAPFLVRRSLVVISALIGLSIGFRLFMYAAGYNYDPWTYRFFPFELAYFLVGVLCYRGYERLRGMTVSRPLMWGAWIAVLATVVFYQALPVAPAEWILFGLFIATVPLVFRLTKDWSMDRALGELSYPVYLTHLLVAGAFRRFAPADLFGETVAMGSILLSLLLVRYVAAPMEALRAARSDGSVARGPVVQP